MGGCGHRGSGLLAGSLDPLGLQTPGRLSNPLSPAWLCFWHLAADQASTHCPLSFAPCEAPFSLLVSLLLTPPLHPTPFGVAPLVPESLIWAGSKSQGLAASPEGPFL